MIGGDSARAGGDLFPLDRETRLGQGRHHRGQPLPRARFADGGTVLPGVRRVPGVEAAADQQPVGVDLQVVSHA